MLPRSTRHACGRGDETISEGQPGILINFLRIIQPRNSILADWLPHAHGRRKKCWKRIWKDCLGLCWTSIPNGHVGTFLNRAPLSCGCHSSQKGPHFVERDHVVTRLLACDPKAMLLLAFSLYQFHLRHSLQRGADKRQNSIWSN